MWAVKVPGRPRPKGSWKCVGRGGRHRLVEQRPSGPWRRQVTQAGRLIAAQAGGPLSGPVSVRVAFTVPLPRSISPARRLWPALAGGVGDIDKLARSVLDSLTEAGVWHDDGQVVELAASKHYPHSPGVDVLPSPGAVIRIWRTTDIYPYPPEEEEPS